MHHVDVIGHIQVKVAITVHVTQRQAHGCVFPRQTAVDRFSEPAPAVVHEQSRAGGDAVDQKVGVAVAVYIGKRRPGGKLPLAPDAGRPGNVGELPAAKVTVQSVFSLQIGEVEVTQSVAIHIGHRDPVSVIVVHRLVVLAGVVHNPVQESNPARLHLVTELEVVKSADAPRPRHLQLLPALHPGRRNDLLREGKLPVGCFPLPRSRRGGLGQDLLQIGSELGQTVLAQSVIRSPQPPDAIDQGEFRTVQDGHLAVRGVLGHFKLKTVRTEVPEIPPRSC